MKAMVLNEVKKINPGDLPLSYEEMRTPRPGVNEVLIRVSACAVCHTELDIIEGRTPPKKLPLIPGHQVVGRAEEVGTEVKEILIGQRLGVAWIFSSCGTCRFCLSDRENLCPEFQATGRDVHGGYAEYLTVPARFVYPLPEHLNDVDAAPLLCAGAIGYRSLRLTGIEDGQSLGLSGFGASGHLVLKLVKHLYPFADVYVFARNPSERQFAVDLGACWAGDISDRSPQKLDAIIETTPVWKPVVEGLSNLAPGGRLVVNAIRKEDTDKDYLLNLNYPEQLWMEKELKSVANVTRRDVSEFLNLAADMGIKPETQSFPIQSANQALLELRKGGVKGAKVLRIDS